MGIEILLDMSLIHTGPLPSLPSQLSLIVKGGGHIRSEASHARSDNKLHITLNKSRT